MVSDIIIHIDESETVMAEKAEESVVLGINDKENKAFYDVITK